MRARRRPPCTQHKRGVRPGPPRRTERGWAEGACVREKRTHVAPLPPLHHPSSRRHPRESVCVQLALQPAQHTRTVTPAPLAASPDHSDDAGTRKEGCSVCPSSHFCGQLMRCVSNARRLTRLDCPRLAGGGDRERERHTLPLPPSSNIGTHAHTHATHARATAPVCGCAVRPSAAGLCILRCTGSQWVLRHFSKAGAGRPWRPAQPRPSRRARERASQPASQHACAV